MLEAEPEDASACRLIGAVDGVTLRVVHPLDVLRRVLIHVLFCPFDVARDGNEGNAGSTSLFAD